MQPRRGLLAHPGSLQLTSSQALERRAVCWDSQMLFGAFACLIVNGLEGGVRAEREVAMRLESR